MNWRQTALAGLKAAAMGSLIGTSLPTIFTTIIAAIGMAEGEADAVVFVFMPFLIGLAVAIAGLVLIGLPITWYYNRRGEESRGGYLTAGLLGGGVFSMLVAWILFGLGSGFSGGYLIIGFFGALTGGATGHFWWRYAREPRINSDLVEISDVFG